MKLTKFVQNFKIVGAKGDAALVGKKRKSLEVSVNEYEPADIGTDVTLEAFAVNEVISQYAKALIGSKEHASDWDYCPTVDQLTLAEAHKWFTTTASKTRSVTAATLQEFGKFYERYSQILLSKTPNGAAAGRVCIEGKLVKIMGNIAACKVMLAALQNLGVAVLEADESETIAAEEFVKHEAVYDWLVSELEKAVDATVSAADLE